jgi:hypothetical protein
MKKTSTYWESMIYRPELPDGWVMEEQLEDSRRSLITFVKWGKIHHNAPLSKLYVVFCEFNPNHPKKPAYKYSVRAGRYSKPNEDVHHFNDLRKAERHIRFICETTNQWLEEVNSPQTIAAYEKKLAAAVKMAEM